MSEINELLRQLHRKPRWCSRIDRKRKIQILRTISTIGTPFTIPSIFRFVYSLNRELSNETARTIHELMLKVKPSQWTQLYVSFRNIEIPISLLEYFSRFPDSIAVYLLGVASLNGNGYVRQESIHRLHKISSPLKIPFILLRLGDWVPQVRESAETVLSGCLKEEFLDTYFSLTEIMDWMTRVERIDLTQVYNRIVEYLHSSPGDPLSKALDNPDPKIRLFCYKSLLAKNPEDRKHYQKAAMDPNPDVRWFVYQQIGKLSAENQYRLFSLWIKDPSPKISSSVMMSVSEEHWQDFQKVIFENGFNDSPMIRHTARFLLKKHGVEISADEYRNRLSSDSVSPGILYGLAETGTDDDCLTLMQYVNHPRSRIRLAALAGLYRLSKVRAQPYLIEALRDSRLRIRRFSSIILGKDNDYDRVSVRKILVNGNSASKISALKVLCCSASWDALEDVFQMIIDKDEAVSQIAWKLYVQWYLKRRIHNWVKPSQSFLLSFNKRMDELNSRSLEVPAFAAKAWSQLPGLIGSGKEIWKY
jgi:HEAT repeat protein